MHLFEKIGKFNGLVAKLEDRKAQAAKPYDLSGLGPVGAGPAVSAEEIKNKLNNYANIFLGRGQNPKGRENALANLGFQIDSMFRDDGNKTPANISTLKNMLEEFYLTDAEKTFLSSKSKMLSSLVPGFAPMSHSIKHVPVHPKTPAKPLPTKQPFEKTLNPGMSDSDKEMLNKGLSNKPASALPKSVLKSLALAEKLEAKLAAEKKK